VPRASNQPSGGVGGRDLDPGPVLNEAAAVLERAVPMLVRWFTRSDVKRSMLADTEPPLSWTDAWLLGRDADPRDGRAVLVSATRTGAARHQRTKRTARAVYERLLADWPEDELRAAAQVARRLVDTMERPSTIASNDR
jgi:hypothetical protein